MKVFSSTQLRAWDKFTIENEPISSIDLMERAAVRIVEKLSAEISLGQEIKIFCGTGNNGGDGLAIGRLLHQGGWRPKIYLVGDETKRTTEVNDNLNRLLSIKLVPETITTLNDLPIIKAGDVVIDALLGLGTNKQVVGVLAEAITQINESGATIYAVDLPSGLLPDDLHQPEFHTIIRATKTYTFQLPKKAFLCAKNVTFIGEMELVDIGLSSRFYKKTPTDWVFLDAGELKPRIPKRSQLSEKRDFGSSLIIGGSLGMMGALVLAAKACLRSGSGLTSVFVPSEGLNILQRAVPEAMAIASLDEHFHCTAIDEISNYSSVAIGPGLGMNEKTADLVSAVLKKSSVPLVIDADALNHIARKKLLNEIPKGSLITPHAREFERLFGPFPTEDEVLRVQLRFSMDLRIYILRKGMFSLLTTPEGLIFVNSTGNPALAKGGSGDVLLGLITGLFARTKSIESAAVCGVFIHGLAADILLETSHEECLTSLDLVMTLPAAFRKVFG